MTRGECMGPSGHSVTHDYAVLAYYTSGRSRVELNGEWNLQSGDVLLVPAGAPHRTLEGASELWVLAFHASSFANGLVRFLHPLERVRDGGSAVVSLLATRRHYVDSLMHKIANLATGASELGAADVHAMQTSLLNLILAEILEAATWDGVPQSGGSVVTDALRFIERNCLGRLSLKDVATAVDRSPAYVTTALTRATGLSAGRWIVSGRMAEARRLLLHSTEKIERVAERVGYADVTHFIRMFRRHHGATPAAWRALHRG